MVHSWLFEERGFVGFLVWWDSGNGVRAVWTTRDNYGERILRVNRLARKGKNGIRDDPRSILQASCVLSRRKYLLKLLVP